MKIKILKRYITCILVVFTTLNVNAQLGFCNGNSGDPIFTEDFGTAPNSNTQHTNLPTSQTDYTFLGFNPGPNDFGDGKYTVTNLNYQQWNWFNMADHTTGDTNGKMLIVNANIVANKFYQIPITGLCENTTYEFSSWLLNLTPRDLIHNGGTPNPCNVRFEIWDGSDSSVLKSGDTGDFFGSLSTEEGEWRPYALVFKTLPGQTSVILKMRNNGPGGYGNDLAVDDIVFKSCGDAISVSDGSNSSLNVCSTLTPFSTILTATPDGTVFDPGVSFQWQESIDGNTWADIPGETNQSLSVTNISSTIYYRSKVAEDIANINNSLCNTFSDVFQIIIDTAPSTPTNLECWQTISFNDATCSWDITGTKLPEPAPVNCWDNYQFNASTCIWENLGTQLPEPTPVDCWDDYQFNTTTCVWENLGTEPLEPAVINCWDAFQFNTVSCVWENLGVEPLEPVASNCWDNYQLNMSTCVWENTGTQPTEPIAVNCWDDYQFNTVSCVWENLGVEPVDAVDMNYCEDESVILRPTTTATNPTYTWSTGATTESIEVDQEGVYEVEVISNGCLVVKWTYTVRQTDNPIIERVKSDGRDIVVSTVNTGDFLYSLDGNIFQLSNRFRNVDGGQYTVYAKGQDCSEIVSTAYLHFYIPNFFTPNNDGSNDTFNLSGIEYYDSSNVSIFDRYGKLLKNSRNSPFSWDGTFNGQPLSSSDYWYVIVINNQKFTGHVALKR